MFDLIAAVIAGLALVGSALSVWYARRSADAADRSAKASDRAAMASEHSANAARAEDRRARTPQITIERESRASNSETSVVFSLRYSGPEDLDSVVVHRPITEDGIVYPVARIGDEWGDEADLGAIALGGKSRFTLSIGSAAKLPEFWIRITCRNDGDEWNTVERLIVRRPGRFIVA